MPFDCELTADEKRRCGANVLRAMRDEPICEDVDGGALEHHEEHGLVPPAAFRIAAARALGAPIAEPASLAFEVDASRLRAHRQEHVGRDDLLALSGLTPEQLDQIESVDLGACR